MEALLTVFQRAKHKRRAFRKRQASESNHGHVTVVQPSRGILAAPRSQIWEEGVEVAFFFAPKLSGANRSAFDVAKWDNVRESTPSPRRRRDFPRLRAPIEWPATEFFAILASLTIRTTHSNEAQEREAKVPQVELTISGSDYYAHDYQTSFIFHAHGALGAPGAKLCTISLKADSGRLPPYLKLMPRADQRRSANKPD